MKQFTFNTPEQTKELGQIIASGLRAGDVLVLNGDLGAGKTTFTKGLAKGLGIDEVIKSPTFTIIREYQGGGYRFTTWTSTGWKTAGQRTWVWMNTLTVMGLAWWSGPNLRLTNYQLIT